MSIADLYTIFLGSAGISIDSRKIAPGDVFFAIKGENFDGNKFAEVALKNGAEYAVIDDSQYLSKGKNMILVEDALKTLQELARFHRKRIKTHVIGISGSNGKTTTRELIYRVLSTEKKCFATPGNLNNHIGLPLSILRIKADDEYAVIELGANHPGEHEFLCSIAMPDSGVITNIGKDHLEGYGGWEGIIRSHKEFSDYLSRNDKLFFLNGNDAEVIKIADPEMMTISYGKNKTGEFDYSGKIVERFPFLKVKIEGERPFLIETKLLGAFHLYNILAAVAVGSRFKIKEENIASAIAGYVPQNNRTQLLNWGTNKIILDAYNANPSSVELMIRELAEIKGERKIAIIGDMFELGEYSIEEHGRIKDILFASDIEAVLVGNEFRESGSRGNAVYLRDNREAGAWLKENNPDGAWILIKGSRGMAMEKVLEGINSEKAPYQA